MAKGREVLSGQDRAVYDRSEMGESLELGERPAVLVVDLQLGFTDPACKLGADLTAEVEHTKRVLDVARERGLPVVFTVVAYERSLKDCALWVKKGRGLAELVYGSPWVELDPRLERRDDETIVVKKGASSFFGTNLNAMLVAQRIDTVVLCGASTSGCIRATAIDLMQHGFPTLVPRECVGDRLPGPHEANLFDIQAKFADVVPVEEALEYLASVPAGATALA